MRCEGQFELEKFLDLVRLAMERYFGDDRRRIEHAYSVFGHARALLKTIEADQAVTLTAAYLHDIGILEAERKYGSCSGQLQEREGPPVARAMLEGLNAPADLAEKVCTLISRHHTPQGIDSHEFRILWDADALVNLSEFLPRNSSPAIIRLLDQRLVTQAGIRRGLNYFLADGECD